AIVARPNYDLDAAKAAVDRIEQSSGATDLAGALQKALEIGREDRQPAKHLYLFTDATRSAWDTPQAQVVAQAGQELATLYRVTHFNLGRGTQWNQALLDVRPASKLVHRFAHDFVADAKGFGNGPDAVLQWKLDDSNLTGGGSLKLDANTPPQTQSQANFKTGGPHVVSATLIGDDRLKIDNARWRVVDVVSELKVLVVEGERGLGTLGGSGAFLALALAPPKEAGDDNPGNRTNSYVAPELISDLELGNKVLPDFGAVVLAGVGSLQPAHADALQKYVQAGGTLMIFMGEGINPDSYNSVLLPRKLMPGALTQRVNVASDQKGYTFDFNPSRDALLHPYLNVFRGEEKSGLNTAQVFSYWRVELPANNGVERVLNYLGPRDDDAGPTTSPGSAATNADPAITAHSLAAGRVVFVSTTANADWTSLPAKPAYLTLMHELLSGSVNAGDAWLNLTVDQPLQIPSTVKLSTAPTLLDPTQKPIVVEPASVEGQTVYRTPPLTQPGVYSLATGAQKYPVAVNVPPQEADVRTLDDAAIKAALGGIELDLQADQLASESVTLDEAGSDLG
ncbi:MAG: vWA domain-containing protein, partial [Tepidisphaeraceae bacterium]